MELTPHQGETWLAALSVYEPSVVNLAIVKACVNSDPFPDLGKLLTTCEQIRRERNQILATDGRPVEIRGAMLEKIAAAFGLEIS